MCRRDDKSLGWCIPEMMRPYNDASLGWCVPGCFVAKEEKINHLFLRGRIVLGTYNPGEPSSLGYLIQGTHRTRDDGHDVHGTHRTLGSSYKENFVYKGCVVKGGIVQGTHITRDASYKGRIVQGTYSTLDVSPSVQRQDTSYETCRLAVAFQQSELPQHHKICAS
jgi:hypothetical protein